MKQIAAILIAFFLCVSTTQVSAQNRVFKEVAEDNYTFQATDQLVRLISLRPKSNCTLPPATAANKGQQIQILNRRSSAVTVNGINLTPANVGQPPTMLIIPFSQAAELISDGTAWFLLNKSFWLESIDVKKL
jgi:hypothetical protein